MKAEHRSGCPINLTLEMLGDRWSLIVIRDMMFGSRRRYRDLLTNSEEGIASNILADRLKRLVAAGLVTRRDDPSHKQKAIYSLTESAIQLVPLLAHIGAWGRRHTSVSAELSIRAELLEQGGVRDVDSAHGRAKDHTPRRRSARALIASGVAGRLRARRERSPEVGQGIPCRVGAYILAITSNRKRWSAIGRNRQAASGPLLLFRTNQTTETRTFRRPWKGRELSPRLFPFHASAVRARTGRNHLEQPSRKRPKSVVRRRF